MKNPFRLLTIKRDENEEEPEANIHKDFDPILEGPLAEHAHKRKVRPADKKLIEEGKALIVNKKNEEEEGFTEIKKNRRPGTPNSQLFEENVVKEFWNEKNIKAKTPVARRGKRMFDRHSGTGRGKEIAKQGAGGKTTWGNPEQLAKEEAIDYMDELARKEEDRCMYSINRIDFQNALRPDAQAELGNLPIDTRYQGQEYIAQGPGNESLTQHQVELSFKTDAINRKREDTGNFHKLDSKKEQKRRKKSLEEKYMEAEPVFEQTENSITYGEYLDQLKKKNELLYNKEKTSPKNESNANIDQSLESSQKIKDHKEYGQWVESLHQKKKKPKEKKLDSTEQDLTKLIAQKLVIFEERKPLYSETSKLEREKESYAGKFARPTRSQTDFPEL